MKGLYFSATVLKSNIPLSIQTSPQMRLMLVSYVPWINKECHASDIIVWVIMVVLERYYLIIELLKPQFKYLVGLETT